MAPRTASATARQNAATREAILEASLAHVRERPAEPFSHESLAHQAHVSPRTIYRHFPTRHDLTAALWVRLRNEHGTRWPESEADIIPALTRTFRQFSDLEALTRAAITAAAGTQYPSHGSAEGRAAFRQCLADRLAVMTKAEGARLVAACLAIYSAPFWQMLRDRGQLGPRDAEAAAAAAMQAVLDSTRPSTTSTTRRSHR
jgi:AcrR family transcriptional regulator